MVIGVKSNSYRQSPTTDRSRLRPTLMFSTHRKRQQASRVDVLEAHGVPNVSGMEFPDCFVNLVDW